MTTAIRARFTRKPCSLDEVLHNTDPSAPPEIIAIEFRKELTTAEYDTFANSLLDDRDWLKGRGVRWSRSFGQPPGWNKLRPVPGFWF